LGAARDSERRSAARVLLPQKQSSTARLSGARHSLRWARSEVSAWAEEIIESIWTVCARGVAVYLCGGLRNGQICRRAAGQQSAASSQREPEQEPEHEPRRNKSQARGEGSFSSQHKDTHTAKQFVLAINQTAPSSGEKVAPAAI